MKRLPDAIFLIDLRQGAAGGSRGEAAEVPVIGLVDTNCDPDDADFVIPGNDDAIRSCSLVARGRRDGIAAGSTRVYVEEFSGRTGSRAEASRGGRRSRCRSCSKAAEPVAEPAVEPEPSQPLR